MLGWLWKSSSKGALHEGPAMVLEELPDGCLADVCSALGPEALSALTATSQSLNKLVLQLLDEFDIDVDRLSSVPSPAFFSKLRHVSRLNVRRSKSSVFNNDHLELLLALMLHLPVQTRIHFEADLIMLPDNISVMLLEVLFSCCFLRSLSLPFINPSSTVPHAILAALPNTLLQLDFQNTAISGADLRFLARMNWLQVLNLRSAEDVLGPHLHALADLVDLRTLTLGGVTDLGPHLHDLSNLRNLDHLDLAADVGTQSFQALSHFTALRSLFVNNCLGLEQLDLVCLIDLQRLTSLKAGIEVTAVGWHVLASMPALQHIDIRCISLEWAPFDELPPSQSITTADLLILEASPKVCLAKLLPKLEQLQTDWVAAGSLASLAGLQHLSKLHVARCGEATLGSLQQLTPTVSSMRSLSLQASARGGISSIANVACLRGLRSLLLAGFQCLDDGVMRLLANTLLALEELTLYDSQALGDLGVASLACLPKLRDLRLRACRKVGTSGVQALLSAAAGDPGKLVMRGRVVVVVPSPAAAAAAAAAAKEDGSEGEQRQGALRLLEVSMCPKVRLSLLRNPAGVEIRCVR